MKFNTRISQENKYYPVCQIVGAYAPSKLDKSRPRVNTCEYELTCGNWPTSCKQALSLNDQIES